MGDHNILEDPQWVLLQDKFDAFLESHRKKWKLYLDARKENQRYDVIKHLYDDSEIAWKSIEETKKEMFEFRTKYPQ